jgi:VWFA-related protein
MSRIRASAPPAVASLSIVLALLFLVPAAMLSQDRQGAFRSSTSLVEVDVIVKDKDGQFVSGLTADDFEVLEEGKPQQIQHFYLVTESRDRTAQPPPGVDLPRGDDQRGRRVFLLIFDAEHLSAPVISRLKHAGMEFVNTHFRPADLGGIYVNGNLWRGRLTNDRQELLDGIRALTPTLETPARRRAALTAFPRIPSEYDALRIDDGDRRRADEIAETNCLAEPISCAQEGGREYVTDRIDLKAKAYVQEARRAAAITLEMLAHATRNLARLDGRKTVALISEGFFSDGLRAELPRIAGQAARAGIAIYTVNATGTAGVGGRILADASAERGTLSMFGDSSQEGLDVLAAETGAVAFRNSDNFVSALAAMASDTSTYYVLAYSPANQELDGKFRRIELKTKWAGVTIRARRGYVASPLPPRRGVRSGG